MAALACTVLLPGAAGALAVVGLSAAASAEQPGARRAPRAVCRRVHHRRDRHCPAPKRHRPVASRSHGSHALATPPPANAVTPATPQALAASSTAPGLPSAPPGEVPPPGAAPNPAGPSHVQVSAKEFSFTLSRPSVAAGPLVIELVNAGQDEHDLHIRPTAGGPDVGAFGIVQPGHHTDIQFDLAPGTYTFYCAMPGHEALGMKATFTIQ